MGAKKKLLDLFTPSGDTMKGAMEGAGELAKDIRTAITGDVDKEKIIDLLPKLFDFEVRLKEINGQLLLADANGGWLQRNWRPGIIVGLFIMVVFDSFGLLVNPLSPDAWDVIKIAMGATTAGHSLEKVADVWNKS